MQKQVIVAGYMQLQGVSRKTGNPYSMVKVTVLEPQIIGNLIVDAGGFEAREFDATDELTNHLRGLKFPAEMIATLDIDRQNKVKIVHLDPVAEKSKPSAVPPSAKSA